MKRNSMNKLLSLIGCIVLIAAMALNFTGCGGNANTGTAPGTTAGTTPGTTAGTEAETTAFHVVVTDLAGVETTFEITTDKATVGEALLEEGLIAGEDSEFGLFVTTVNGITADWDADQTYWAFYIDGEYALTGVDSTGVTEGATYSFVLTGPTEDASAASNVLGEGATVFRVEVTDPDGAQTTYEIHTDETTVGAALLGVGLISGEDSEYGLYVTTVNGITLDWDKDQKYWAFYIDGEYAMTGVDATEVTEGAVYSFKAE